MYKHLLIATDGSELAGKALQQGVQLAKALGAKVTVVTVTDPWTSIATGEVAIAFPREEYEKSAAANAAAILSEAAETAKAASVPCATIHVQDRMPADGILATAKAKECDLIVMSSHGRRGLALLMIGSQAARVVANSAVPVLICR